TALLVDMKIAGALVVAGIEVVGRLDARLLRSRTNLLEQRPTHARCFDSPFAADGVGFAGAKKMVLMLPEDRQHVVPTPSREADLAPMVIVGGWAAHVDHGVDGGGPADPLAARISEAAPIEPRLGLGLEHPVRTRIADGKEVAARNMEPDPVVLSAR